MEFKNLNSTKLKIILLDIFPSLEDLENQDKSDLSIIFHGINMFYDLEELLSQKKEVIITPNPIQIKITMSIVKSTDVIATGQMIIKHGTQWVTFLYENKEKSTPGNLALNLIDCIKINISCEILNQNNTKKRNCSIEFPERKDIMNKITKKSLDNFQKITKKMGVNKKNHNTSQEHCNSEFIENIANINNTNKKTTSNDYNLDNQVLTSINKEHNKKYDLNNLNNNLNNSINSLHKQYSNNNFYSLKKLKSQNNTNNKKLKKRVNNSSMNISGIESKTLTYNSTNKNHSKPKKADREENNCLSSTLKNFNTNNINRKNIKKYLYCSGNENNPNFQNYTINIDELLSNKITEHINVVDKNCKNNNYYGELLDKNKYKKINNYNTNKKNNSTSKNKLMHSKTKTSNFINVNVTELHKSKNDNNKKYKKKSKNRLNNNNSNLNNKYLTNNNSILNNKKAKNNNLDLEISTNSLIDETDKNNNREKKGDNTISTKKNKKIMFSQENVSETKTFSVQKTNKSQYTNDKSMSDKSYDQVVDENETENEFINYNKLKEDFMLVYNDEYIKNIQEDLLKLEVELFIEKITELIKEYHMQINLKSMEHELFKSNYKNNVKDYLYQWKLYNKLQYVKILHESKIMNPLEDKKEAEKNDVCKININQKEMVLFKTLFSDNKNDMHNDNNEKNNILKNIILNVLGNNDKNIMWVLKNDRFKKWIQQNISYFLK